MTAVRPFPWATLDATNSRELRALSALRRAIARHVDETALVRELTALVGVPVSLRLRRVQSTSTPTGPALDGVAVVFADADRPSQKFVVEAEGALASALVAGALRSSPTSRVVDTRRPVSARLAGAFAALLATAARRALGGRPLRVLTTGTAEVALRELEGELLVASFSVLVGDEAFLGRVLVPRELALSGGEDGWDARSLATMGDALLSLPIVAYASLTSRATVSSLSVGDAWMPGEGGRVSRSAGPSRASPSGALHGPVLLAASSSDRGVCADLGSDGRLVLRGGSEDLAMAVQEDGALVENLGEVPVVVRVEIGTAAMRAREWAGLRTGDVIALGSRIGEPVTLRVGGVPVARGELVEIEGEVGVRILSRGPGPDDAAG